MREAQKENTQGNEEADGCGCPLFARAGSADPHENGERRRKMLQNL